MRDPAAMSRRTMLATAAASSAVLAGGPALAREGPSEQPNPARLQLLTSTDSVNTPRRGAGVMKLSFSNPEPSVDFGGLIFGFEIITFENVYGIDPATVTVTREGTAGLTLVAKGLTWAGGQQRAPGSLTARLVRSANSAIEWEVEARLDKPIKAIKTIVRGLPRGRLSASAREWIDPGEDETRFEYPALMDGMGTPLAAIEGKDGRIWGISALQTQVRPARFAFLPGPEGYKVELLHEQAGWDRRGDVRTATWRIASAADFAGIAAPHFETVRRNWNLPDFASRADAPSWMKHLALVLALHGEHWTGYVFNDFDRQLEILRWTAKQIDPQNVMVFLPGWDGRYYWDYPAFRVGAETGGEAGLARLIAEGKTLGFRFALMFGSNIANPQSPLFAQMADAQIRTIYGVPMAADYVDWDGDRKGDASMTFMNLAVPSWRDHLKGRISDMITRFGIDAYFLDICGLWENNLSGDMLEGTRTLVSELAALHPGIPPIAEMQYDALMGFIPMNQVARFPLYPQANFGHVASYNHLSWPAPGRGSSGVHEAGFGTYRPVSADQPQIPTITFVDDSFTTQRTLVAKDIATAKARFAARGNRT
ncbi:hypothetical protein SLG_32400 [Sphingobium sp. SYK-6]|nr:hypothetical protein SLG_32400 [Sphingobium sp. SYK-6]